jgi:hypothetical protein
VKDESEYQMSASSRIDGFSIEQRIAPAFDGRSFGRAGQYELVRARVHGSLDPSSELNRVIDGLDKAPLNLAGRVEYGTEVALLRPMDLSKASGTLVYEVINRSLGSIDVDGRNLDRMGLLETMLERGAVVVNAAWQGELSPEHGPPNLAMLQRLFGTKPIYAQLPRALEDGKPVRRRIRFELEAFDAVTGMPSTTAELTYPATEESTLQVFSRRYEGNEPAPVPAGSARLRDRYRIEITPVSGAAIYDVFYEATDPVVSGVGFVVPRDLVSFLRHDAGDGRARRNPLLDDGGKLMVQRAYAYGFSQSGRFLREFLWLGFNQDAAGREVFDGIIPVIAGGRRGSLNGLFAQPGVLPGELSGHRDTRIYPFAYPVLRDPVSGTTDGLLRRCQQTGTCPKIMQIDSENEVANGWGWMLTTGPEGNPIGKQPDNVRLYALAGGDHGSGVLRAAICRAPAPAPVPTAPFVRAALVSMDDWVRLGKAPPDSRYPDLADGTLTDIETAKASWPAISGYPFVDARNVPEHWVPGEMLPVAKGRYPVLTPAIDQDGNAIGGIRHPLQAVPTGTISGVGVRLPGRAAENTCPMIGEYLRFARTRQERQASGDPRPSLEERYPGGTEELVARRRAVAQRLVEERYLLPSDEAGAATGSIEEGYR